MVLQKLHASFATFNAGLEHHKGFHDHTALVIRQANHATFSHCWVLHQCVFNLGPADVVAGRDDHVVVPCLVKKVAVGVLREGVARVVPAGYNVAAPEVEAALLKHPAVLECAVVGKPDAERGMLVKAFCVLRPGYLGDAGMFKALQDHVKAAIAPFKYPREIEFVASLPRTETGKLQRFKLRHP